MEYCFLNNCYVDESNKTLGYSIVVCSEDFLQCRYVTASQEELTKYLNNDYVRDFDVDSGYLKCSSIPRIGVSSIDFLPNEDFSVKPLSLYRFLVFALRNKCVFLGDSVRSDSIVNRLSLFSEINVSLQDLSLSIDDSCIVSRVGKKLELHPFYYALPVEINAVSEFGVYQKEVLINDAVYKVYRVDFLNIYGQVAVCPPLINQSAGNFVYCGLCIEIVKKVFAMYRLDYSACVQGSIVCESGDYASFVCDYHYCSNDVSEVAFSLAKQVRHVRFKNPLAQYAFNELEVLFQTDSFLFASLNSILCNKMEQRVFSALYLYRIAVQQFLNGGSLPKLCTGSSESCFTQVTDGKLRYGEVLG